LLEPIIPIFFGFSFETIIVASFKNPEIRTGRDLKAGKSCNETVSESPPSYPIMGSSPG